MEFVHMATAYILRWNKSDYKEIIGVFLTENSMKEFMRAHFTPDEIARTNFSEEPMKIETGRYYEKRR